jgi:hypothetical protein
MLICEIFVVLSLTDLNLYLPKVSQEVLLFFGRVLGSLAKLFSKMTAMSVEFISTISGACWVLTNVYAPCLQEGKQQFLGWLHDVDTTISMPLVCRTYVAV